jgi:hypothetical protein
VKQLRTLQSLARELEEVVGAGAEAGWSYAAAVAERYLAGEIELARVLEIVQEGASALIVLRERRELSKQIDANELGEEEEAVATGMRARLAEIRIEYSALTAEQILEQLQQTEPSKAAKGAKGNLRAPHVAAELSRLCGAFGFMSLDKATDSFRHARVRLRPAEYRCLD